MELLRLKRRLRNISKDSCPNRPTPQGISFNRLDDHDMKWIERPFTEAEIREVVWNCDGNKSPGPDGYTFNFIKRFWDVLKGDIMCFLQDFYGRANLTKACTTSFIALIPKVNNHQSLLEYRLICLVGCLLKIISKISATRIKSVIRKLISNNQSTFIPVRNIADGILTVNEVLDLAKRDKRSCMVLKVDYEKAYENVGWNYLRFLLKKMEFGDCWIKWMKCCVFNSSIWFDLI